jgi:hypothetical protein
MPADKGGLGADGFKEATSNFGESGGVCPDAAENSRMAAQALPDAGVMLI